VNFISKKDLIFIWKRFNFAMIYWDYSISK